MSTTLTRVSETSPLKVVGKQSAAEKPKAKIRKPSAKSKPIQFPTLEETLEYFPTLTGISDERMAMPMHNQNTLERLYDSVEQHGVLCPIELTMGHRVLNGNHRLIVRASLGIAKGCRNLHDHFRRGMDFD